MQFIKSVVIESDHLGILPPHVMQADLDQGRLVALPVTSPALRRSIALYQRERHPLSSPVRAMISMVDRVTAAERRPWRQSSRPS